jgi:RES domain
MVLIYPPPPTRNITPKFKVLEPGIAIERIFAPTSHGSTARGFRYYGPLHRFDHQRCDPEEDVSSAKALVRLDRERPKGLASRRASRQPSGKPTVDPDRGIMYAGFSLSCCLVEVFGDQGSINIKQQKIAHITLTQSLKLLDLRGSGAWDAGSVVAMATDGKRRLTQAWGCYFYEHPELYSQIDGLMFNNAHNGESAISLYERAEPQIVSAKTVVQDLNDPALRNKLLVIANRLNLLIEID